ncbi:tetratricopeptide repeat protein [Litoribacter ruber]|uniref:tetratricopeptide repeat protein n=1 Tax=Litoribacter ruber TaxID=702568 RepID=UPI001BDA4ACB|nr:tetratricopeptide repeat protein [Litoribacter ruber]MBT0810867.1 tetratricopeptide repeat protein [Litoribacter ruber]
MNLFQNNISKAVLTLSIACFLGVGDTFAQEKLSRKERKELDKNVKGDRLFVEGQRYMMLEEYDKAYFYFGKAQELKPNEPAIKFKMAEILARANDTDKALELGKEAIELDPGNKYYNLLIAEVYKKKNKPAQAAEVLQGLMDSSDDNQHYILELASLYLTAQDFDNALSALDQAEEYYGVVEQLTVQKQRIYLRKNNLNKAIEEGEKLIEAHPGNSSYVLALVEILFNNGKGNEALTLVEESLETYPQQPELQMSAFTLYKERGEREKANEYLRTAFESPELEGEVKAKAFAELMQEFRTDDREQLLQELEGHMVSLHPNDADVQTVLGDRELFAGNKEKALQYYQQSISIKPDNAHALQSVITLKFEMDQDFEAIEKYTEIGVDEFSDRAEFWFFDGTAKAAQKKHEEAKESLEQADKLNRGRNKQLSQLIYGQLGDTYHSLGEQEKAYEFYDKGLEINPNDEHILNNYAYFLSLSKSKLDKAKQMSEKLVRKFPDNSTYLDTHAWVLFQLEEFDQAKNYMEKALAADDSPSGIMYEHYGDILYQLGQKSEALKYWKKAEGKEEVTELLAQKIKNKQYYE